MSKYSEIKQLLREIVKDDLANQKITPQRGTVTQITGQSCSVELYSGFKISDVKLKSVITEDEDCLILYPVLGSDVLIYDSTIVAIDKVAKLEFSQSGLKVIFDSEDKKVSIKNSNSSLLELFEDLTTIIKQLKVFTSTGPSGTPLPDTISAVVQLEQKVNQLLK